jgi:hypothetical protein
VRRFVPALRRIASELRVPEATRARILLEMASDLESLVEHYRARGMSEEEASARAEEKLLVSPDALQHLVAVHTTGYRRWVDRAAGRLRWGFDLLLFAVAVAPMLAGSVILVSGQVPAVARSPLAWPLLAAAVAAGLLALAMAYALFVRGDRSTSLLHRGLPALPALGASGPLVGALAATLGVHRLAMSLAAGPLDPEAQRLVAEQAGRDATIVAMGLLLAFGAGLAWFVLVNRLASLEQAESLAVLGMD